MRFLNSYPQDVSNEWETIKIFHNEDGIPITTHKRPTDDLRIVLITNGPLAVRYEKEIVSVAYNKDGIQTGYEYRIVDKAKYAEDSRLLSSEMGRINAFTSQCVQDYIDGKIDASDVSRVIESIYNDLVSLSIALGNTDGNDSQINAEILRSAQSMFSSQAMNGAYFASQAEGLAFAKESYGLSPPNLNVLYYDAKYYYANEDLQEICKAAVSDIARDEGFADYRVQDLYDNLHPYSYCYNTRWSGDAQGLNIGMMKDIGSQPPRDFKMFFAPNLYSYEDRQNGSMYCIFADNSSKPNSIDHLDSTSFNIWVPRGVSLFKNGALAELPNLGMIESGIFEINGKKVEFKATYDISKYIEAGLRYQDSLAEFFKKYIRNFDAGELTVWQNGIMTAHEVPFDTFFSDKREFAGSELKAAVAHSSFINNFEFSMFKYY